MRMKEIKRIKRIHPLFGRMPLEIEQQMIAEYNARLKLYKYLKPVTSYEEIIHIGKYQWLYFWRGHRISVISLPSYWFDERTIWESCGGGISKDVVRYATRKQAEKDVIRIFKQIEKLELKGKTVEDTELAN